MGIQWLWFIVAGVATGIVSGLFGVGGGALLVPILTVAFGFEIHKAVAISLAVIIPTAISGTYRHSMAGNVDWIVVLAVALGSIVGAHFGAGWALGLSPVMLRRLFALFLVSVAVRLFFSK